MFIVAGGNPWPPPLNDSPAHVQLHCLQVAIATLKGGIAILRSLLTDNSPSPGKVCHSTGVYVYMYVPSLFSNSGVGSFTSHKNQISESVVNLDLYGFSS